MSEVKLEPQEILQGALSGVMRQTQNIRDGRQPSHGSKEHLAWQTHIEGALGEMALAKHFGMYWQKGKIFGPDVGDYEVRTTHYPGGRLLVHEKNPDDSRYYLLTGLNGHYFIRGWLLGKDCKREEWMDELQTGRPCYCVPQSALNPV